MKKNKAKKLIAAIMALSMVAAAQLQAISAIDESTPDTESTSTVIVSNDFENGIGFPWYILESGTAKLNFDISDGSYNVNIVCPGGVSEGGEDRWDARLQCKGFNIISGHKYQVKFDIASDISGRFYTRIGNLAGDIELWNGDTVDGVKSWKLIPITAGETLEFEAVFTATETLKNAEWSFHFGGDGSYTPFPCFPQGTNLYFDNMSLIDLSDVDKTTISITDIENYERQDISVNQIGYYPDLQKKPHWLALPVLMTVQHL